ncbi:MAG: replication initiator [Solirubrobacteraceae bacterium]
MSPRELCDAIRQAAGRAHLTGHAGNGEPIAIGFGEQLHTRVLAADDDGEDAGQVAAYVAKYASKASHERITTRHSDPEQWRAKGVPDHLVQLTTAAQRLSESSGLSGLARWVHMLGPRGHFVTKSRRYSTTLGELRAARAAYRAEQDNQPENTEIDGDDSTVVLSVWQYIGSGYLKPGDAMLAAGIEVRFKPGVRSSWICAATRREARF